MVEVVEVVRAKREMEKRTAQGTKQVSQRQTLIALDPNLMVVSAKAATQVEMVVTETVGILTGKQEKVMAEGVKEGIMDVENVVVIIVIVMEVVGVMTKIVMVEKIVMVAKVVMVTINAVVRTMIMVVVGNVDAALNKAPNAKTKRHLVVETAAAMGDRDAAEVMQQVNAVGEVRRV